MSFKELSWELYYVESTGEEWTWDNQYPLPVEEVGRRKIAAFATRELAYRVRLLLVSEQEPGYWHRSDGSHFKSYSFEVVEAS